MTGMNGDPLEGCEEDFLLGLLDSLGDLETWVDESAADGVGVSWRQGGAQEAHPTAVSGAGFGEQFALKADLPAVLIDGWVLMV